MMMKKCLLLALVLFVASAGQAAITRKGAVECLPTTTNATSCTASLSNVAVGDSMVLFATNANISGSTYSLQDDCGQTWSPLDTGSVIEVWIVERAVAPAGTCSITLTTTLNNVAFRWGAILYSGVGSRTARFSGITASGNTCTQSFDNLPAGMVLATGFYLSTSPNRNLTAVSGSIVLNSVPLVTQRQLFVMENTVVSAGTLANTATFDGAALTCNYATVQFLPVTASTIHPKANAFCQIGVANSVACTAPIPMRVNAGDTILLFQGTSTSANSTWSVTDDCSQHWIPGNNAGTGVFVRWWYVLAATAGNCTITTNYPGGATTTETYFAWTAQSYSGVGSIGANSGVQSVNTVNGCSASLSLTNPNNYLVGGFVKQTGATWMATSGILRSMTNGSAYAALVDATSSTLGTFNVGAGWTGNTQRCSTVLVELIAATATANRTALSTDALHSVLLANANSASYLLPSTALSSKDDWCTWVMPTGASANTYALSPQSTELNGQTADITVPSWQMTRLCEDSSQHYWANPPLKAGNGVTITPSATAITISATTSVGGAVTKIGGGTFSLTNENFPANTCVLRPSTGISAPGVQDTDVVTVTRQSSASGWGQGRLKIDAIPFSGTISIEICNADMTNAINPASPLLLNWLVVR